MHVSDGILNDKQAVAIKLTDVDVFIPDLYFINVANAQLTEITQLGIADVGGGLVNNDLIPQRTVVASSSAGLNIVSTKFLVASVEATEVWSDPVDYDFVYLTDAEIQTKINAIP